MAWKKYIFYKKKKKKENSERTSIVALPVCTFHSESVPFLPYPSPNLKNGKNVFNWREKVAEKKEHWNIQM